MTEDPARKGLERAGRTNAWPVADHRASRLSGNIDGTAETRQARQPLKGLTPGWALRFEEPSTVPRVRGAKGPCAHSARELRRC